MMRREIDAVVDSQLRFVTYTSFAGASVLWVGAIWFVLYMPDVGPLFPLALLLMTPLAFAQVLVFKMNRAKSVIITDEGMVLRFERKDDVKVSWDEIVNIDVMGQISVFKGKRPPAASVSTEDGYYRVDANIAMEALKAYHEVTGQVPVSTNKPGTRSTRWLLNTSHGSEPASEGV